MQKHITTYLPKTWLCLFAVALLLLLAACGGSSPTTSSNPTPTATSAPSPTPAPTEVPTTAPTPTTASTSTGNSVTVADFAFSPASLTIKAGTTVTWTNKDNIAHTATADQGAFAGALAPGKSYSFTFNTPGTYNYHCAIHPSMTAVIIVQ